MMLTLSVAALIARIVYGPSKYLSISAQFGVKREWGDGGNTDEDTICK